MGLFPLITGLGLLTGLPTLPLPPSLDFTRGPASGWRLVGVYESSGLMSLPLGEEGAEVPPNFVWIAAPGMTQSCGPAKAPDGLGVFEAEAVGNRLAPALMIVLERSEAAGEAPLRPDTVRVSLGRDEPSFTLQPLVEPRTVAVRITGEGELRFKQLVRTQLEMELCMEHKTGRGWVGGGTDELRQAFLLDAPKGMSGVDRKFFGGQSIPVPGLLGPAEACLHRDEGLDAAGGAGSKGDGSLDLVPTDVWGSGLRWCTETDVQDAELTGRLNSLPLKMSETGELQAPPPRRKWGELVVNIGPGQQELDVAVDISWQGQTLVSDKLFSPLELPKDAPADAEAPPPGLMDVLARVPHTYPSVGPVNDADRYTVLIVPNWQLVEGLRQLYREQGAGPFEDAGVGIQDGVGWVLQHPELLFVQVPASPDAPAGAPQPNLAEGVSGEAIGLRNWGYTTGMLGGRTPLVLPATSAPVWDQVVVAHRARQHGLFMGALLALGGLLFLGLRRLADLRSVVPEERVAYWPAREGEQPAAEQGGQG